MSDTWSQFGLLPCLFASGESFPWYAVLIYGLASLIFLAVLLISNTAVSRATYMSVKGNNFYTWREAYAFSFRKVSSILLTPVSLALLIGFILLGAFVVGLIGKIPFIGVIGISLFTILWFVAALFLLFFIFILVVSVIFVPSIIATTDEDAFEAVFQTFSLTWNRPWKIVFYEMLTIFIALISMGLFAFVVKESFCLMTGLFSNFMGSDFVKLANNGYGLVQSWLLSAQTIVDSLYHNVSSYIFFSKEFNLIPAAELPVSVVISSYLFAFCLLFVGGWVFSYGLSTFTIGNTVLYIALRKQKDDENLLERQDKEEEAEDDILEKEDGKNSDRQKGDKQRDSNSTDE